MHSQPVTLFIVKSIGSNKMKVVRSKIIVNDQFNSAASASVTGGITTVDKVITGLTDLDLTGYSGELIVNLISANANEILYSISNYTNVRKITLRPENGLVVTVYDTNGLGGGYNIYLNAATKVPDGNLKGFLELTKRGTDWYETNFIDQYNPLS